MGNRQYRRHLDRDSRRLRRAQVALVGVTETIVDDSVEISEEPVSFRGTIEQQAEDIIDRFGVFFVGSGKVFHKEDSTHIPLDKEKTWTTEEDALSSGLRYCKTCYIGRP